MEDDQKEAYINHCYHYLTHTRAYTRMTVADTVILLGGIAVYANILLLGTPTLDPETSDELVPEAAYELDEVIPVEMLVYP